MSNEVNNKVISGLDLLSSKLSSQTSAEVKTEDVNSILESLTDENGEIDTKTLGTVLSYKYDVSEDDQALLYTINQIAGVDGVDDKLSLKELETQFDSSNIVKAGNWDMSSQAFEDIKADLYNEIEIKKANLQNTKKNRGALTSIGNGISEVFGGGDKKSAKEIEQLEAQLKELENNPSKLGEVYESIKGEKLNASALEDVSEANELMGELSSEQKLQVVGALEEQAKVIEDSFNQTKSENGWISGGWDKFKNWSGIGASSNKTQSEIDEMNKALAEAKDDPDKLAKAYKTITGSDLTTEELTKLTQGETSLVDKSNSAQSVSKYKEGQTMATDTIADIASGVSSVLIVSAATAAGIVATPFTGGASLGMIAGGFALAGSSGAAIKTALKASDCIGNEKTYTLNDAKYDLVTGGINGMMAPLTEGLGSAAGTGIMKAAGMESLESVAKSSAKQVAVKTVAKAAQYAVDGSLSGAADGAARAIGEGRYDEILTDAVAGGKAGLVASPLIGFGFDAVGVGASKISSKIGNNVAQDAASEALESARNELVDNSTGKVVSKASSQISDVAGDNIVPGPGNGVLRSYETPDGVAVREFSDGFELEIDGQRTRYNYTEAGVVGPDGSIVDIDDNMAPVAKETPKPAAGAAKSDKPNPNAKRVDDYNNEKVYVASDGKAYTIYENSRVRDLETEGKITRMQQRLNPESPVEHYGFGEVSIKPDMPCLTNGSTVVEIGDSSFILDNLFKNQENGIYTVGRNPRCNIVLDDPKISGRHLQIQKIDDKYIIRDLKSTNGTVVIDRQAWENKMRASSDNVNASSASNAKKAQNTQNAQNPQKAQNAQGAQNAQNAQKAQNPQKAQNTSNAQNVAKNDIKVPENCFELKPNTKVSLNPNQPCLTDGQAIVELGQSSFQINNLFQNLQDGTYIVGRNSDCDIVLNDPRISRKHLQVQKMGDKYIIQDLSSANGTKVMKKTKAPMIKNTNELCRTYGNGGKAIPKEYIENSSAVRNHFNNAIDSGEYLNSLESYKATIQQAHDLAFEGYGDNRYYKIGDNLATYEQVQPGQIRGGDYKLVNKYADRAKEVERVAKIKKYDYEIKDVPVALNLEGVTSKPINSGVQHWYPEGDSLDSYFEQMYITANNTMNLISTGASQDAILESIAIHYQYAANARPFKHINNSLFMNEINTMLEKAGMPKVIQGNLDHFAQRLQPDDFVNYFKDFYEQNNLEMLEKYGEIVS